MKKVVHILMCISLIGMVLTPVKIHAAEKEKFSVDHIDYQVLDDHNVRVYDVEMENYINNNMIMEIPATVDHDGKTYHVKEVDIDHTTNLVKKIILSEGIEKVSINATRSYEYKKLESLELPATVKSINDGFTRHMPMLKELNLNGNTRYRVIDGYVYEFVKDNNGEEYQRLISSMEGYTKSRIYTKPAEVSNLTEIGEYGFANDTAEELRLPKSVTRVLAGAFNECSAKKLDLTNITETGMGICNGCEQLETVTFGKKTPFLTLMFYDCPAVKTIEIPNGSDYIHLKDGVVFGNTSFGETLAYYPPKKEDKEYQIPFGTEFVAMEAFCRANNLEKLYVPTSVTRFAQDGFNYGNGGQPDHPVEIYFCGNTLPKLSSGSIRGVAKGSKLYFADAAAKEDFIELNNAENDYNKLVQYSDETEKFQEFFVMDPIVPQTIGFKDMKELRISQGSNSNLGAFLSPDNATGAFVYECSDPDIVEMRGNGKFYTKRPGKVIVTVKMGDKKVSKTIISVGKIEDAKITAQFGNAWDYTGAEIKPNVDLFHNDAQKYLTRGEDFIVAYQNNVKPGRASLIIRGIGCYEGEVTRDFLIQDIKTPDVPEPKPNPAPVKKNITGVSKIKDQIYNGRAIKPSIRVTCGSRVLKNSNDYKVSYSGNKNCGKGKVIIQGKGNYQGKITSYFKIIPKKASMSKLKAGKKKATVFLKRNGGNPSGYQIRYSNFKNFKKSKYKYTSKTSYVLKKLKRKKYVYVKIRAYKMIDGKRSYGAWSAYKKTRIK